VLAILFKGPIYILHRFAVYYNIQGQENQIHQESR